MTNKRRILPKITAWVLGIWVAVILILEILLSTPLLTKSVNRIAADYIDGEISFGKVSASMLKNFPSMTLTLEDLSITYPSDRFDKEEKASPQGMLMYMGNGETADTLASFSRFSTSIRVIPVLFGNLIIRDVSLEGPRIFAHAYGNGRTNWNMFRFGEAEEDEDSTALVLPRISIGKIGITDNSQIVYTDSRDTIFTFIELKQAVFDGRLSTRNSSKNRLGLSVDSMFVAGRVAADTLAFGLNRFHIHEHDDHMDLEADAKTTLATSAFGRMNIPINLSTTLHFPKDSVPALGVHNFRAEIAALPFEGEADLRFHEGRTEINGELSVTECQIDDIMKKFVRNFIPEADQISTDAVIGLDATFKGDYVSATGQLPTFHVDVIMPQATFAHKGLEEEVTVAFDAFLANTRRGVMNFNINDLVLSANGLSLNGYGNASDILSDDPTITLDGSIAASLDSLMRFVPDSLDMTARGSIAAQISGTARLSHLGLYTFSQSDLTGKASSDSIVFRSPGDSISVTLRGVELALGPESVTSRRDTSQTFRLVGVSGKIGEFLASYKEALSASGKEIAVSAKNAAVTDTLSLGRLGGRISAKELSVADASGTSIDLDDTQNGFQMMPDRNNPKIPVLTLSSSNKRINLATEVNRAILTDASIEASATMTSVERRQRRKALIDSLSKIYPDVPEDSLLRLARGRRQTRELPQWLQDEDFAKQDIDIRLDQSISRYFREWDMHGDLKVRTGILMTPYFPLRNILRGMEICFTNDRIAIDSLKVMSGESTIAAKGELTGLRRALTGGGRNSRSRPALNLRLEMSTDRMNANEILTAYNSGSHFDAEEAKDKMAGATDAEFLKMVVSDTSAADEKMKLLVIPGNLNADITLDGNDITWSDLNISDLKASLMMKERCVQITNTMATSNIGNVAFEGFYATRSKEDIKAGFNFEFKDITAEKAIDLMPAVDTLIPLLKSFSGKLDCELAATASLDTNMNILMPTINGVMRVGGNDLTISDSEMFTSLAKKLKFDDMKTGRIPHMTVEGVIKDNVLEVFPFVLKLDRYTLALSGKQNLDLSYRYHASIIRSPMLIKVGVDVYGKDFDNMKFKIGRPKYKNEKVPVFTAVIDETKINLAESIRGIFEKGVEAAVNENERQEAIIEHRNEIGYVNAVDQETEELSDGEQIIFDMTTENNIQKDE